MLPVGFEPMVPASARPQTYALDRAATWMGRMYTLKKKCMNDFGWTVSWEQITRDIQACGAERSFRENTQSLNEF
jgi:hypothetical protein